MKTTTYQVLFSLEPEFGIPGAVVVNNGDKNEFFLRFVIVELSDGANICFNCNSWVYPESKTNADRLFFSNTSYLPSKTPVALQDLRLEELVHLRGNGTGRRMEWERIYDYALYNDLGDPDKGEHHVRPVLGGSKQYPYPRRGRTGRPLSHKDRLTETRHKIINLDFYVPPEERFSPSKLSEFITNSIHAVVHFVIPEVKSLLEGDVGSFKSFDQMRKDLYSGNRGYFLEGKVMESLKAFLPEDIFAEVVRTIKGKTNSVKFPVPRVIATNEYAWKSDEEFAREMLAGINPVVIRRLEAFPPVGSGGSRSSITNNHVERNLGGLSIQQAMYRKRIFILDHQDYLMPYLAQINSQGDICAYASRTLLFLRDDETLMPLVIELSLPGPKKGEVKNRVFLPASEGNDAALWQLAKAHVAVNDSGYHQLISHWQAAHACRRRALHHSYEKATEHDASDPQVTRPPFQGHYADKHTCSERPPEFRWDP
ncbi:linoleate 9S-lipoxygenase 6-like [Iris pallida]|uniref:Linoleate 9S-lipoxygenase 6-like n=1 Tax=Iris pallida TaxID=29817 RepID=A0AAX6EEP3_IRIPA|nr:linoleate 9S-lipoxygenase 6-like [Iris pallida]